MGTSALMTLGTRAMFASFASLQTTSQNISNANVEGYSRQQAELRTAKGQFTGAGFFGKGVDVATVSRSHDAFLTREAATARSLAAMDSTRADQLGRLEEVFPTGESGIGHASSELMNAMVDLASRPGDSSTRQVVLSRAAELAARFRSGGEQIDSLQSGVTNDLKSSVASVNAITKRIADVNQQIALVKGLGHTPNDLLDQRDQLVAELSDFLQVSTVPADDGTLGVFIAGGQRLVLGNEAQELQITPDPDDSSRSALGILETSGVRPLPDNLLTGGSIVGLLRFQNEDLIDARNLLGQMAVAISTRVNEQQALGLDLRTPAGSGSPIFAVGPPKALPAATNERDGTGNFVASVSLTITDATALYASDYSLRPDPNSSGNYLVTRLSDGLERSIASGDEIDGMRIDVGTPAPAASDRFLLQPVGRAANAMHRVLDDPRGIAAAAPLTATASPANTGTATVGSLTVVSAAVDDSLAATIDFTSATGDYAWELRDAVSGAVVSSGTGTWQAGTPISLNGSELVLNGVPASGDRFNIDPTPHPDSNNGNALALAALRDETLVGRRLDGTGTLAGGETITDAYASALADIGVRVRGANLSSEISASVSTAAEAQRSAKAGVNLDEEAARLIQFQQSYQAAAKVLQVAQSVFDTLLSTAGG